MDKLNQEVSNLEKSRHSLAHIMAAAVKKLWPETKFAIGPAIENGFYYDFDFGDVKISDDELLKIEGEMEKLISENHIFEKSEMIIIDAIARENELGQIYKKELIEELANGGAEKVGYFRIENFIDLCRGPHIESTDKIEKGSYKLTKLAGAYWRGDEKNRMLTRIYGVAFLTKVELDEYLRLMEEAEKRDHRKLGKELDLFMTNEIAPGMPFFLPKGMIMLLELTKFVREHSYGEGYKEVRTPQILNAELWKISGHWEHYREDMFCMHHAEDDIDLGIKPMNCPAHMLIFKRDIRSYKDLPLRLAETTTLYRNEKSGTLHGLTRVRSLSQDDTHIFLREQQVQEEISNLLDKVKNIYKIFNLDIDEIHLSTRPDVFLGEKSVWDKAEDDLKKALSASELQYRINEGDGAFYGPKIDIKVKDAIGRQWQLATIQLDFQLPRRFELYFVDSDGSHKTPVVVHRALLGSMERFLGIIIEHYMGFFPVWLSPVQIKIISVGEGHIEFCNKLASEFKDGGIRVEVDDNNETVGNKIRKATAEKVPYMLVIGDKEMASNKLMVRDRGSRDTREISKEDFIQEVQEKIKTRS